MRESRLMIIVSLFLFVLLGPLFYLLYILYPNIIDYYNVAMNLYCGIIVALITSICEYLSSKRKIVNSIYSYYFDFYRLYYYCINGTFIFHYNSFTLYKKLVDLNPKIIEALDEYHGFLKEKDKTYMRLNPTFKVPDNMKNKNIKKSLLLWFNKKYFEYIFKPLISEIENILIGINKKRFEIDKSEMIRMYNIVHK